MGRQETKPGRYFQEILCASFFLTFSEPILMQICFEPTEPIHDTYIKWQRRERGKGGREGRVINVTF